MWNNEKWRSLSATYIQRGAVYGLILITISWTAESRRRICHFWRLSDELGLTLARSHPIMTNQCRCTALPYCSLLISRRRPSEVRANRISVMRPEIEVKKKKRVNCRHTQAIGFGTRKGVAPQRASISGDSVCCLMDTYSYTVGNDMMS